MLFLLDHERLLQDYFIDGSPEFAVMFSSASKLCHGKTINILTFNILLLLLPLPISKKVTIATT